MHIKHILYITMMLVGITSCTDDDPMASRGLETVEMPISISIPAEGFSEPITTVEDLTRAPGDPGSTETLRRPKFIYIFLVSKYNDQTTVIYKKISNIADDDWTKRDGADIYDYNKKISISIPQNRTEGRVYAAASYADLESTNALDNTSKEPGMGGQLSFLYTENGKPKNNTWSEARAANFIVGDKIYTDKTEDKVKNIVFASVTNKDANGNDTRNNLQNIYSTPYNKQNDDGKYYGTINDYASHVPQISMTLYHVATKLDIQWTVDEAIQGTEKWDETTNMINPTNMAATNNHDKIYLSLIECRSLPKYGCLLFRPCETSDDTVNSSYDLQFLGVETKLSKQHSCQYVNSDNTISTKQYDTYYYNLEDKGSMYYGRNVMYVIPKKYGNYSCIDLRLLVNEYTTTSAAVYNGTESIQYRDVTTSGQTVQRVTSGCYPEDHATKGHNTYIQVDNNNAVFTPWIRTTIQLNSGNVDKVLEFTKAPESYPVTQSSTRSSQGDMIVTEVIK